MCSITADLKYHVSEENKKCFTRLNNVQSRLQKSYLVLMMQDIYTQYHRTTFSGDTGTTGRHIQLRGDRAPSKTSCSPA